MPPPKIQKKYQWNLPNVLWNIKVYGNSIMSRLQIRLKELLRKDFVLMNLTKTLALQLFQYHLVWQTEWGQNHTGQERGVLSIGKYNNTSYGNCNDTLQFFNIWSQLMYNCKIHVIFNKYLFNIIFFVKKTKLMNVKMFLLI